MSIPGNNLKGLKQIQQICSQLRLPSSGSPYLLTATALLIVEVVLSAIFWGWLNGNESPGATIRNIGLVIAGSVALPLALWRGVVADKQASAAQQQADMGRHSLLNERYQKGAEMLGSPVLAVRMAGIYALQQLAQEHPDPYHIQIMNLFCAFVRRPPHNPEVNHAIPNASQLRQDVQAIMDAIAARSESRKGLEQEAGFTLDLRDSDLGWAQMGSGLHLDGRLLSPLAPIALGLDPSRLEVSGIDLSNARLDRANLQKADLGGANLSHAQLNDTNLSGAWLERANLSSSSSHRTNLSRARLKGANLSGAFLDESNLTGALLGDADVSGALLFAADLSSADLCGADTGYTPMPVTGLAQSMLDVAIADADSPPKLGGVVLDAETGEPLVWRK